MEKPQFTPRYSREAIEQYNAVPQNGDYPLGQMMMALDYAEYVGNTSGDWTEYNQVKNDLNANYGNTEGFLAGAKSAFQSATGGADISRAERVEHYLANKGNVSFFDRPINSLWLNDEELAAYAAETRQSGELALSQASRYQSDVASYTDISNPIDTLRYAGEQGAQLAGGLAGQFASGEPLGYDNTRGAILDAQQQGGYEIDRDAASVGGAVAGTLGMIPAARAVQPLVGSGVGRIVASEIAGTIAPTVASAAVENRAVTGEWSAENLDEAMFSALGARASIGGTTSAARKTSSAIGGASDRVKTKFADNEARKVELKQELGAGAFEAKRPSEIVGNTGKMNATDEGRVMNELQQFTDKELSAPLSSETAQADANTREMNRYNNEAIEEARNNMVNNYVGAAPTTTADAGNAVRSGYFKQRAAEKEQYSAIYDTVEQIINPESLVSPEEASPAKALLNDRIKEFSNLPEVSGALQMRLNSLDNTANAGQLRNFISDLKADMRNPELNNHVKNVQGDLISELETIVMNKNHIAADLRSRTNKVRKQIADKEEAAKRFFGKKLDNNDGQAWRNIKRAIDEGDTNAILLAMDMLDNPDDLGRMWLASELGDNPTTQKVNNALAKLKKKPKEGNPHFADLLFASEDGQKVLTALDFTARRIGESNKSANPSGSGSLLSPVVKQVGAAGVGAAIGGAPGAIVGSVVGEYINQRPTRRAEAELQQNRAGGEGMNVDRIETQATGDQVTAQQALADLEALRAEIEAELQNSAQ